MMEKKLAEWQQQALDELIYDATKRILDETDQYKLLQILEKKQAFSYETGIKQDRLHKIFVKKVGHIWKGPFNILVGELSQSMLVDRTLDNTVTLSNTGRYFMERWREK